MIEKRKSGMSLQELKDKYGIAIETIRDRLSKLMSKDDIEIATNLSKRKKYNEELFAKIVEDRKTMTFIQISKKYNIDTKTIWTWFSKYKQ